MSDQSQMPVGILDYLQRVGEGPNDDEGIPETPIPRESFQWLRVLGSGSHEKGLSAETDIRERRALLQQRPQLDSFLAGFHSIGVPIAFSVSSRQSRLRLHVGTWHNSGGTRSNLESLEGVMRATYPLLDLLNDDGPPVETDWERSGVALGVPPPQIRSLREAALPIDRLLGAVASQDWGLLILAAPMTDTYAGRLRDSVFNEMRLVELARSRERAASPLATSSLELLKPLASALTEATATGLWRTAIFLCGTSSSYPLLAGAWKTIFAGSDARAEPVRVWEWKHAAQCARGFSMPDKPGMQSQSGYQRPFHYQTMLSSDQLAAYVHLPESEHEGFSVSRAHRFDINPNPVLHESRCIVLGTVVQSDTRRGGAHAAPKGARFEVAVNDLSRHAFVTGVTGAGKTNTIFTLLKGIHAAGVPFLVLEPAKAEYRRLLADPIVGNDLRVYTLGDEQTTPIRLNPFEVIPGEGNSVANHLNMLRAVFTASFGLWSPLPEIIEQALYAVYERCGWNVAQNANPRVSCEEDVARSFPTLSRFCDTVDELVLQLGYERRTMSDIRAALSTRLNSLRSGGKGRMLDCNTSISAAAMFESNCVLELERMGSEADRSFIMGLLLLRLSEYRRSIGPSDSLQHVVVLEEAHRLLSRSPGRGVMGQADPTQHAIESFVNLLAEVRSFGEGVVIADQVPSRLAPEVLKNTNLKIAHRLVAEDDRLSVGATMVATPQQLISLATLPRGVAAMFREGEDAPLLVQMDLTKDNFENQNDASVLAWMQDQSIAPDRFRFPSCLEFCHHLPVECDAVQLIPARDPIRLIIERSIESVLETPFAVARLWPEVYGELRARSTLGQSVEDFARCAVISTVWAWSLRRGTQRAWTFSDTYTFAEALTRVMLFPLEPQPNGVLGEFREISERLLRRTTDPYPRCTAICGDLPSPCRHRETAERYLSFRMRQSGPELATGQPAEDWMACKNAAARLIEWPPLNDKPDEFREVAPGSRRMSLCLAQAAIFQTRRRTAVKLAQLDALLRESRGS